MPMDQWEWVASLERRRKAIADEVEQIRVDQAHWNSLHPAEAPVDVPLDDLDALLARFEEQIARARQRLPKGTD